jgi:hypothetical protein
MPLGLGTHVVGLHLGIEKVMTLTNMNRSQLPVDVEGILDNLVIPHKV